jgi:hypothetical protein
MATLSEQDKQKIKDSVIASCISKGIKPTTMVYGSSVPNPLYANCVQLGYDDAMKQAEQGKLNQWFSKVNTFVQSQGGASGLLQNVASIANQYRGLTPDANSTQFPKGYGGGLDDKEENNKMGLWIILIVLLIVLIIASFIYFNKNGNR